MKRGGAAQNNVNVLEIRRSYIMSQSTGSTFTQISGVGNTGQPTCSLVNFGSYFSGS